MRTLIGLLVFLAFGVQGAWAAEETALAKLSEPPTLVLMPPEMDGDLGDSSRREEWAARLDLLDGHMRESLAGEALYTVIDNAPADDLLAQLSHRASVYQCEPCVVRVGERVGAERVLNLRVHRMSQLVLSLHAILRDTDTGRVRYARYLSFRGDDDRAWLKAADYLIRDMEEKIPPAQR